MNNTTGKIQSFTDLETWQKGHSLVLTVYKKTTEFPKEEKYSLVDQMKRSAVSITSNIAEGFGRQTYKEKVQFYYMAQGSLTELKNQLIIARDVGYISKESFGMIMEKTNTVHKLLNGLIKKSKTFV